MKSRQHDERALCGITQLNIHDVTRIEFYADSQESTLDKGFQCIEIQVFNETNDQNPALLVTAFLKEPNTIICTALNAAHGDSDE